MFERTRPVVDPVTIRIDRREVVAERGEPLAAALLAAGETTLARSPKLHRPRGPACLRGDCDGCLARVDGVPNVMTCLRPARGGEEIGTQNVLGSRKTDLLRLTDWFFPRGIDHHHLMAGIPAVGTLMQTFARQMAGIGRLPETAEAPHAARRIEADVLVVGAGLAGLSCAAALVSAGREVVVVDEQAEPGGSAGWYDPRAAAARVAVLTAEAKLLSHATMVGYYEKTALIVSEGRATVAAPRVVVLATGAHDGVVLTEGNDLPGVLSTRAVVALARRGILPREGAVLIGSGPWSERASELLGARVKRRIVEAEVARINGRGRVSAVELKSGEEVACSVVAVELCPAPAFELGVQAGAATRAVAGGFALVVDDSGLAAPAVYAAGECTGLAFDAAALIESGERVARSILALQ